MWEGSMVPCSAFGYENWPLRWRAPFWRGVCIKCTTVYFVRSNSWCGVANQGLPCGMARGSLCVLVGTRGAAWAGSCCIPGPEVWFGVGVDSSSALPRRQSSRVFMSNTNTGPVTNKTMAQRFFDCSVAECRKPSARAVGGGCDICHGYFCGLHMAREFHKCSGTSVRPTSLADIYCYNLMVANDGSISRTWTMPHTTRSSSLRSAAFELRSTTEQSAPSRPA